MGERVLLAPDSTDEPYETALATLDVVLRGKTVTRVEAEEPAGRWPQGNTITLFFADGTEAAFNGWGYDAFGTSCRVTALANTEKKNPPQTP